MDHLVLAVPNLALGIEHVEQKTGVRACFGGQHPGRGTHNAGSWKRRANAVLGRGWAGPVPPLEWGAFPQS